MMRWVYLLGVSGIVGTLISDIWCDVDYEVAANVSLIYIAILAGAFAGLYLSRSKWWTNRIGKVFLAKCVILTMVLVQASLSVWWQDDYPGRQVIRFIVYSMGVIAYLPMLWSLWREQQRDRRGDRLHQCLDGARHIPPSLKGALMQNITIGRYKAFPEAIPESSTDVAELFDGWIEGIRDDGSTWIMWLDADGNPTVFYPNRDADGGVLGEPVDLSA